MSAPLGRRVAAEAIGTGLLVAVVVGSGIQATELHMTSVSSCSPTPWPPFSAWAY